MSFQDFFIPIVAFLIGTWAILTPPITRATDILAGVVFGIGFSSLVLSITFARNAYNKREKEVKPK